MTLKTSLLATWIVFISLSITSEPAMAAGPSRYYRRFEPREEGIRIQYQTDRVFPQLTERVGQTLGIAPFKDIRRNRRYIGHFVSSRGAETYFKSDPHPLEKAFFLLLSEALLPYGIKVISVGDWEGRVETLKDLEVDSILKIEIRRFWSEGRLFGRNTIMDTSIYLIVHVGLKKESTAFTNNFYMIKESTFREPKSADVEEAFNHALSELLDDFFSNLMESP